MDLARGFYERTSVEVARDLLGKVIRRESDEGVVAVRITEAEAYSGTEDPASHAYRGKTPRTEVMFGPPGHLYVYFTYGMHYCINVVCGRDGEAAAVLIRAGEVIEGVELARARRPAASKDRDLARGPARLTAALALSRGDNGTDLCVGGAVRLSEGGDSESGDSGRNDSASTAQADLKIMTGPRVGVSTAADIPWRFWIDGDPTVSDYKRHVPKKRGAAAQTTDPVRADGA